MRFNRFVFLNRPMLSLETHLGVTASPQAPFPTDYVTLPVSASHRRFGSLPLAAEEGHAPVLQRQLLRGPAFQTCSSSFTPVRAGYAGWAYDKSHPSSTRRWRGRHDGAVAGPCAGARLGDHDGAVLPPHAGCDRRSTPRQDTVAHHPAAAQQAAPEASWQTAVGGRHPAPPGVLCASGHEPALAVSREAAGLHHLPTNAGRCSARFPA